MASKLDTKTLQQMTLEQDTDRPYRITIGSKIGLRELAKFASDKAEEDEEIIDQIRELDLFYEEALVACARAAVAVWGYTLAKAPIHPFTGQKMPCPTLDVATGYGKNMPIAIGWFTLPGIEGLFCVQRSDAGKSRLRAQIRRKNTAIFEELARHTVEQAAAHPLYAGSFVEFVEAKDDDGDVMPGQPAAPVFLPIPTVDPNDLVLPAVVRDNVETVLFNPIQHIELWRQLREKPATKIVLAGEYGTGKSLTAAIAVRLATEAGFTVVDFEEPRVSEDRFHLAKNEKVLRSSMTRPYSVAFKLRKTSTSA